MPCPLFIWGLPGKIILGYFYSCIQHRHTWPVKINPSSRALQVLTARSLSCERRMDAELVWAGCLLHLLWHSANWKVGPGGLRSHESQMCVSLSDLTQAISQGLFSEWMHYPEDIRYWRRIRHGTQWFGWVKSLAVNWDNLWLERPMLTVFCWLWCSVLMDWTLYKCGNSFNQPVKELWDGFRSKGAYI